jgi:hypothetical protein
MSEMDDFALIEPIETEEDRLKRHIVDAINDGDECGAEFLHARLIEKEIADWAPRFKE